MNEIRREKETITAIALSLAAVLLIIYAIYSHRTENEIYDILQNPTFIGTIAGKETTTESFGLIGPRFTVHRLHVIGEYYEDNERIELDHIFVVSAEIYYQFEIGDIVSNGRRANYTSHCSLGTCPESYEFLR